MGYKLSIRRKFTENQLHPPRTPSFDTHPSLRAPHLRGNQPNQFKVSLAIHRQRFDLRHPSPILCLRQTALPRIGFDFDLQDGGQDLLCLEDKFGCSWAYLLPKSLCYLYLFKELAYKTTKRSSERYGSF